MMNKVFLDTNIVSALFKNDLIVLEALKNTSAIFLSVIVTGELYYGAFNSEMPMKYISQIINIEKQATIVECNEETGKIYGAIKAKITKKSIRIPDNDIWIAALAIQYKVPLVSRDKHFEFVEGLELLKW